MKAAAVKAKKQNESRAAANSIFQKKNDQRNALGFANNRPGPAAGRLASVPNGPSRDTGLQLFKPPSVSMSNVETRPRTPGTRTLFSSIVQRATVVRGGTCKPEQFVNGAESIDKKTGKLKGVSTSSNIALAGDLKVLGNTVYNNQIGVSTTNAIGALGGKCTSTPSNYNPWHTDLDNLTGKEASSVFKVQKNPNPKKKKKKKK